MLDRVTVVGCGLIGGSIVKGLRAGGHAQRVSGIDRAEVLVVAAAFLDEVGAVGSAAARALLERADLVVLASPVAVIIDTVGGVLDAIGPQAVVTDTGSVKGPVLGAISGHRRAGRFVAAHPMAGRETGGFEASSPTLFEGARWLLVTDGPSGMTRPDPDAVLRVSALAAALGASPASIEAEAHDRAMAYVSHVPQLVASAVYDAAATAGVLGEAGPGFRDMTRIAGGPIPIWRDIFQANREQIAGALGQVLAPLVALSAKLSAGDEGAMQAAVDLLEQAQRAKSPALAHQSVLPDDRRR